MNRLIKKETYINVLKKARQSRHWTCDIRTLKNILETIITKHSFTNDSQLFTIHLPQHSLKFHLPPRFTNHLPHYLPPCLPQLPPWLSNLDNTPLLEESELRAEGASVSDTRIFRAVQERWGEVLSRKGRRCVW